jgi:nitronate monooxygenase
MTALHTLLGIEFPLIQAPMAGSQGSALALAVSHAGGLGSLPGAMLSPEALRAELLKLRGNKKPYNVNFFCHTPAHPSPTKEAVWRNLLSPYFGELGLERDAVAEAPSRAPYSAEVAALLAEFKPPVVSFHFGLPAAELVAQVKGWGGKVLSTATTLDEGRWLQKHGADAVIAQGLEAGGHRGHFLSDDLTAQVGTMALVPQLVAALEVPVIATGGISDARGVAAAMALGAAGVQVGTAYLLCPEASTRAVHRAALKADSARHTALTTLFSGRPARGIVNRLMTDLGPLNSAAPAFPLAGGALAPLRAASEALGRGDFSPLWAGQHAKCRELPAGELTRALAQGFTR